MHRLYLCRGTEEMVKIRDGILKGDKTLVTRAQDEDNQLLYLHGMVRIPSGWPKPTSEIVMTRVTRDDDGLLQEIHHVTTLAMEGHIASDGSCSGGEFCQALARSGWGVVQVEHGTGKVEKAIYGAVWEPFPSTRRPESGWRRRRPCKRRSKGAAPWTWTARRCSMGWPSWEGPGGSAIKMPGLESGGASCTRPA